MALSPCHEVVAAVGFAWLLLVQLPGTLQLVGGAFVLAGVVVVKLGERPPRANAADTRPVRAAYDGESLEATDDEGLKVAGVPNLAAGTDTCMVNASVPITAST